jgi:membrane protease YdiL (CAAX protease family)
MSKRIWLALEFLILFFVLPAAYAVYVFPLVHPVVAMWGFSAWLLAILLRSRQFDRAQLWTGPRQVDTRQMKHILLRFLALGFLLLLWVIVLEPNRLFDFPRMQPWLWLFVVCLYPVLSAYPQGIAYRAFMFQRYGELFGHGWGSIIASAFAFSFAHIAYRNPVAVFLTFVGGLLFAVTYARTKSVMLSGVEHALYGDLIFTIGLGHYIYTGAVRLV